MKKLSADELRSVWLEFFRSKDHTIVPSDSLVPQYDPTLLFTGAGMNQFKDDFLGKGTRPYKRATSSQKCLRTQDLEVVGKTNFHHTFFEMLGNFSFGDYFKREAIEWAWEFVTQVLQIPVERLAVSVYETDDEAYNIWANDIGVKKERIYRFGAKDNYWPANSPNDPAYRGPCGPCSEIFYDYGEEFGPPGDDPSSDSNRFCEFWNLVFQEYNKTGEGPDSLEPLPKPGIDTGAGLERILALLHGVHSNFQTPHFLPLIAQISGLANLDYKFDSDEGVMVRRIADHVRAAVFCAADGVWVGNEGRDYVLRKIIRRAVRDGRKLGIDGVFLPGLVDIVVDIFKNPYPELGEKRDLIVRLLQKESETFLENLDKGEARIQHFINTPGDKAWIAPRAEKFRSKIANSRKATKVVKKGEMEIPKLDAPKHLAPPDGVLDGQVVCELETTYGFPADVTKFILAEHGYTIDEIGYFWAMVEHMKISGKDEAVKDVFDTSLDPAKKKIGKTEFTGYGQPADDLTLKPADYIVLDGKGGELTKLAAGQEAEFFAKRTPFYAEQGGQVADTGWIDVGKNGRVEVTDCQLRGELRLHRIKAVDGPVDFAKQSITLKVDNVRRNEIRRHHTATHLLHHALREVLGTHVHQKGSLVAPDRLRFDFTHTEALTAEQIEQVESLANTIVFDDGDVSTDISTPDEAKKRGAMALFGEKYGDEVRVVACGPTIELCGGTHVRRSGEIGGIRIVSQASSAAGVRRIEALCGRALLEFDQRERRLISDLAERLKSPAEKLPEAVERLQKQIKEARDEAKKAMQAATQTANADFEAANIRAFWLGDDTSKDALAAFVDKQADEWGEKSGIVLAVGAGMFLAKASAAFTKSGGNITDLIKKHGAAHGIRGGGSPHRAQGKAPASKDNLIALAEELAGAVNA